MKKYDVWFCKCGHIHLMPTEYLDWVQEDWRCRSIIRVCQNCGATYKMWLSDSFYGGYDVNGKKVENFEIWENANTRFLFNKGIEVPLVHKDYIDYATYYYAGSWFYKDTKCEVNTTELIKLIQYNYKYEAEDILKSISRYITGIDWTGTHYAK